MGLTFRWPSSSIVRVCFMAAEVDDAVAALIRSIVPSPAHVEAEIEFVDRLEDAGVDHGCHYKLRVAGSWLHTVFAAGLSRVGRHYPLALEPVNIHKLIVDFGRVELWRAATIEREYAAGLTGRLVSHGAGRYVYVARTLDGHGASAHSNMVLAVRQAFAERRLKGKAPRRDQQVLADFRDETSRRLQERLTRRRFYDEAHAVATKRFCFLPWASFADLQARYGRQTVRLVDVERWAARAVQALSAADTRLLLRELDAAIDAAQVESPPASKRNGLSLDAWRALFQLADGR